MVHLSARLVAEIVAIQPSHGCLLAEVYVDSLVRLPAGLLLLLVLLVAEAALPLLLVVVVAAAAFLRGIIHLGLLDSYDCREGFRVTVMCDEHFL